MHFHPRRKLLIGAAVLAACSFGGGAYAATQESTTAATPQAFLKDVAKRLGVTPQQLTNAFQGAMTDQLNAAVKAGKLTQAQANAIEQRVRKHRVMPFGLGQLGFPGGPRPRGFFHFKLAAPSRAILGPAAKYLGISSAELRSELRSGQTLQQIAKEHGKSLQGLKQAIRSQLPRPSPSGKGRQGPGGFVPPGPGGFGPGPPTPPAAS